ncbi:MAG TPA: 4'-phosphopantetheinyl transferase superfamily protein [Polyangiaceae bacterium]|nr:4'-phosphopantetheinyl transferase superfamily protein [Polyangiaceae bacterium]
MRTPEGWRWIGESRHGKLEPPVFEDLLPADILTAWGDPSEPATEVLPEEDQCVARAVAKRRNEFRKTREYARRLLREFGVHDFALLPGLKREPVWPEGIVGSVTHTDGFCAVAIGPAARYAGIGIDAEPNLPIQPDVARHVCLPEEYEQHGWISPLLAARLIFSAKESIYKSQFYLTRQYLGFFDVKVQIHENGSFVGRLLVDAGPLRRGAELKGAFRVRDGLLVTSACLRQGAESSVAPATLD